MDPHKTYEHERVLMLEVFVRTIDIVTPQAEDVVVARQRVDRRRIQSPSQFKFAHCSSGNRQSVGISVPMEYVARLAISTWRQP